MPEATRLLKVRDTDRLIGVAVVGSAIVSALLILRVTDKPVIAAAFAATGMLGAALILAFRHLYPREAKVERGIDWSLVRTAAEIGRASCRERV